MLSGRKRDLCIGHGRPDADDDENARDDKDEQEVGEVNVQGPVDIETQNPLKTW